MAKEFIIKYCSGTLSNLDLARLDSQLRSLANDVVDVKFVRREHTMFVYSYKLRTISDHEWICDGYFYLDNNSAFLQADTGTRFQIELFFNNVTGIFNDLGIQVTLEEA